MASMSALVSSGGRIFYIFDEGPTAIIQLPQKRVLIARDAFNGTILWKRSIPSWHTHLWPFKSGPAHLPRRLIAVEDRVYVTLGFQAPLTALDAATGKTIRTYKNTNATEEVIASEGVLFLMVNDKPMNYNEYRPAVNNIGQAKTRVEKEWPWDERPRHIMAIRADTGKILWSKDYRIVPLTLAADKNAVYFHDGKSQQRRPTVGFQACLKTLSHSNQVRPNSGGVQGCCTVCRRRQVYDGTIGENGQNTVDRRAPSRWS
jgi:outer membrane protein assembly factor BamB